MPSTSWNRLFRCFEDCRVEVGGILADTVFGEGDRLGADVSEFPEALPVCLLVVPAGGHFSSTGVDLLGKGQDYRFVVTASKLLTDFSFSNLLGVVCSYGNIRCAGCFPHSWIEGWGIGWGVDEVCLFDGCLTSQQQARVSQGRICSDNFTCCHTEIEVAEQTFYLTQSHSTLTTGRPVPALTL